jgi:microcystin-dependent protein
MSSPFVAEIRMFAGNFAPTGWASCDGQLLPISQNTALFSLLGTYYGGDGKSTFALPNLSGSSPMQAGAGSGLSDRFLGEVGGVENVTLIITEIPVHTHLLEAYTDDLADLNEVSPNVILGKGSGITPYSPPANANALMSPNAISIAGGSLPHNNMMPFLAVYFIIALQGVFPPRG